MYHLHALILVPGTIVASSRTLPRLLLSISPLALCLVSHSLPRLSLSAPPFAVCLAFRSPPCIPLAFLLSRLHSASCAPYLVLGFLHSVCSPATPTHLQPTRLPPCESQPSCFLMPPALPDFILFRIRSGTLISSPAHLLPP